MKLIPALEYEKLREDAESWNKVYVHKEGKFYHIYEWSAWLIKQFVCTEELQQERGDKKILQANRYKAKENEYVMIGFPVESLSKYIPEYANVESLEDGSLEIVVSIPEDVCVSFEQMQQLFSEWKELCPMKKNEAKSKRDIVNGNGNAPMLARSGMFHILSQLLAYPVESTTSAENVTFIGKLKQEVAALL